jgi:hypothetical protein
MSGSCKLIGNSLSRREANGDCKPGEGKAELGWLLSVVNAPLGLKGFEGIARLSSLLCFFVSFLGFADRMRKKRKAPMRSTTKVMMAIAMPAFAPELRPSED